MDAYKLDPVNIDGRTLTKIIGAVRENDQWNSEAGKLGFESVSHRIDLYGNIKGNIIEVTGIKKDWGRTAVRDLRNHGKTSPIGNAPQTLQNMFDILCENTHFGEVYGRVVRVSGIEDINTDGLELRVYFQNGSM